MSPVIAEKKRKRRKEGSVFSVRILTLHLVLAVQKNLYIPCYMLTSRPMESDESYPENLTILKWI